MLGDVRQIAPMPVDLLVQMLAEGEKPHPLRRIPQETTQSAAVLAPAVQFGVTPPVLGRFEGLGRRRTQLPEAMLQQPGGSGLPRGGLPEPLGDGLHVGNEHLVKVVMPPIRQHMFHEPTPVRRLCRFPVPPGVMDLSRLGPLGR